jgi:nucleoside-diphosphate-sugar epimerase
MSCILVTGANGFIGSHLVELLLKECEENDEILCMVRPTSDLSNIIGLLKLPNVKVVIGDVTKPETLLNAVLGVEYIYHLAAALKIPSDRRYFEVNFKGTENMLKAAFEHASDGLKRFLLVSSQAAAGPSSGEILIDEEREGKPVCAYGRSKLQAEQIAKSYMDRLPITIVRPSAVYGARERDLTQTIPAVENRIHPKIGFTKKYASFINADDLVRGFVAASRSEKSKGQTYFLTDRNYLSDIALVKTMAKAIGRPFGIILPIPKFALILFSLFSTLMYWFFRGRPGMALNMVRNITQKYWLCSSDKAKRDFSWETKIPLIDGMKRTYELYKKKERQIKEMPDERRTLVWGKYFFLTLIVGAIVEVQSVIGGFFYYEPWWMLLLIILIVWAGILGLVAMLTRKYGHLGQFLITFIVSYTFTYFDFSITRIKHLYEGKLFGISNTIGQTAILAASAGILVLIVNSLMRVFYKHKLRIG